ncbi:ABC transporter permease [Pseudolabrys taiwanensis]|uniref:ABC transporter permease n=1 Tax=Pseudolabrys taiwanensis TaxID=331696 RepID=A0A345ZQA5_9HYPH|nr:ABC transporter permease [Pseudolabrys taiwanensis]AXK79102.1 ABC transporter permease [Pseudolabrys taiwanensis]
MRLANIFNLGGKELRSLARDRVMLVLIVWAFTGAVYTAATAIPETLNKASIAIVDEDGSALSNRIVSAFYPPYFNPPKLVSMAEMDAGLDDGSFTFALDIPPNFERDVVAGRAPSLQLNVDATRVSQAFTGAGYIQNIALTEVVAFLMHHRVPSVLPVDLALRMRSNPTLNESWFGAVVEVINQVTLLSIILTGAALIREREHGTIEHLLVMPVTPFEIMVSKIWSMALVVALAWIGALTLVVQGILHVPLQGSLALALAGAVVTLYATTSLGIVLATTARSMPQFALLTIIVIVPLEMLSGGATPRESMPQFVQDIMLAAPTTHFIMLAQAILFRGAGFDVVWPQFLALFVIGTVLFSVALVRFRKAIMEQG